MELAWSIRRNGVVYFRCQFNGHEVLHCVEKGSGSDEELPFGQVPWA